MSIAQPQLNAYTGDLAIELAGLVQHAYELCTLYEAGEDWQDSVVAGYENLEIFEADPFYTNNKIPFGFVATKEDNLYIVFRGTADYTDWHIDALARIAPFTSFAGMAHHGFLTMYASCWDDKINEFLLANDFACKNLYITGHSLGGALATLCIIDTLNATTHLKPTIYTFASPKVGNNDFATKLNTLGITHFRVFNTDDDIPKWPPSFCGDYIHVGIPKEFTQQYGSISNNHNLSNYIQHLGQL